MSDIKVTVHQIVSIISRQKGKLDFSLFYHRRECRIKETLLSVHLCINSRYPTVQMTHRGGQTEISQATF